MGCFTEARTTADGAAEASAATPNAPCACFSNRQTAVRKSAA